MISSSTFPSAVIVFPAIFFFLLAFSSTPSAASRCLTGDGVPLLFDGSPSKTMPGFYSPNLNSSNSSTFNVACTPTTICAAQRSLGQSCTQPQSDYEPALCAAGNYCPNATTQITCPKSTFCLFGRFEPAPCPPLSYCPEGSKRPIYFGGVVLIACLLAVVLSFIVWYHKFRSPTRPSERVANASISARKKILSRAVKRARVETQAGMDSIRFDFKDLCVSVKVEGKSEPVKILKSVSGSAEPGKVTAIVGPSGCGKSTLFKTLLRKFDDDNFIISGENKVNGSSSSEDFEKLRSAIAFVPQDDILHNELSVQDNIFYSSELALPRNWKADERAEFREVILSLLGLARHRNTKVGTAEERGLSGGQRKRCAIACQMASAPAVIFLDEPTAGQDSSSSLELIRVLKDVAVAAKISVIMVIHQPRVEIWHALDRLLVLAPGGKTVYEGPANQATAVLGEYMHLRPQDNPADILLDVVSIHGEEMAERWASGEWLPKIRRSSSSQESLSSAAGGVDVSGVSDGEESSSSTSCHPLEAPSSISSVEKQQQQQEPKESTSLPKDTDLASSSEDSSVRQAHPFRQFLLMHLRVLQKLLATYQFLFLEWLILLITGLILGSAGTQFQPKAAFKSPYDRISFQPIVTFLPQMLMYTKMSLGLAGSVSGVKVFGEERIRFRREADVGLSVTAYFFAAHIGMMYRALVSSTVFSVLVHLIGQWPTDYWTTLFPNLFLVYLNVNAIGEIISLLTTSEYASVIAATTSLATSALNGFIGFPYWMKVLSYAFWSSQHLYRSWYSQVEHIMTPPYRDWDYKPEEFTDADGLGIMTGNFVIYSFIVWSILMWQHREK